MRNIIDLIKGCLFPIFCLGCNQEGQWLCEKCLKQIDARGVFYCPLCHQPSDGGNNCAACQRDSFLTRQISVTPYHEEELIGKIIRAFKYHYAEDLQILIKEILRDFISRRKEMFSAVDLVIPVPLHRRRQAERGFNQSEIIAKIVAEELNKPMILALRRTRFTRQQAKLNRLERSVNIQDAFQIKRDANGEVLLVDDVYTTGATMQECARILKQSSYVREVIGFTLARG